LEPLLLEIDVARGQRIPGIQESTEGLQQVQGGCVIRPAPSLWTE
jgi:hypothetical protein